MRKNRSSSHWKQISLIFFLAFSVIWLGVAQEAAPPAPNPVAPSPATLPGELATLPVDIPSEAENKDSDENAKTESPVVETERSIYIPYEDLEAIFEKEGRGVFLPYKEFLDLWNQLSLDRKGAEEKPPSDGVVLSADYLASVEGKENQVLAIDATLQVESFKTEGWAVVPLIKAGLSIAEADTGEATIHLGAKGYELILPRKGKYEIKLRLYASITKSGGRNESRIVLPRAGVSKFEANLPEEGWEFEFNPAAAYSSESDGQGGTRLAFFLREIEQFDLTWKKQGEETQLTPLLFVEANSNSKIVPGAVQSDLELQYKVLRSGVDRFEVSVPKGQEILHVTGENIREWDVTESGDTQKLVVQLHSPAKQAYHLKLSLEEAVESLPAEYSLPNVVAENVVRQRGTITVQTSSELEVETIQVDALAQQSVEPSKDPALRTHARYRYLNMPFSLDLAVKKAEPSIEVDSWTRFSVDPDKASFLTRFDYEIKQAGVFETALHIPAGYDGVEAAGEQVDHYTEEEVDGKQVLTLVFKNKIDGKITFNVSGRRIRGSADDLEEVPVFQPLGVKRHDGKVGLQIHTSLDPQTESEGDLRQQEVSLLGANMPGEGAMQTGFQYRGEVESATMGFTLKKPQISGQVNTLVQVREQLVRYVWHLNYQVLYAGVDTFYIAVPQAISDDLRHEGQLIKEVNKNYQPAAGDELEIGEGNVIWELVLRDKQMGEYNLQLTLDRPISESQPIALGEENQFTVELPVISLRGVQTEVGQIAVLKDDNLEILSAKTSALEAVDPQELAANLNFPGVFLSYKYRQHPISMNLVVSRNAFLAVPQAVVTYANITSVMSNDRGITSEVIYWVKNNAKQFFSVVLPEGGKMVSDVYVGGQPQQPMRRANEDVLLIRLPAGGSSANTEFPIRFIYEIPSPHPGEPLGMIGSAEVPVADLTDAEILQSKLTLYLPVKYVYKRFSSAMQMPTSQRGWIRFRNLFDWVVPTLGPQLPIQGGHLWEQPKAVDAGSGAGFDFKLPTGGQSFVFHRLDAPDDVKVSFRSKGFALFWEALFGLLAFSLGMWLIWKPMQWRVLYVGVVGFLPLIVAGAVSPMASSFWTAIYLGAFLAAVIWCLLGCVKFVKRIWFLLLRFLRWIKEKWVQRREARAARRAEKRQKKEAKETA